LLFIKVQDLGKGSTKFEAQLVELLLGVCPARRKGHAVMVQGLG